MTGSLTRSPKGAANKQKLLHGQESNITPLKEELVSAKAHNNCLIAVC